MKEGPVPPLAVTDIYNDLAITVGSTTKVNENHINRHHARLTNLLVWIIFCLHNVSRDRLPSCPAPSWVSVNKPNHECDTQDCE